MQHIASRYALGGDNVATLTIGKQQQGDVGSAVRVVLDTLDLGRDTVLEALEVNYPVVLLVPPADMASGDPAIVVATAVPGLVLQQGLVRCTLVQFVTADPHHMAATG